MTATMADEIVSPIGRSLLVWKYFGFSRDSQGKLMKDKATCKLCSQKVLKEEVPQT